jgi:hypothetical protein
VQEDLFALDQALAVASEWRSSFAYPLRKVTVGVRQFVQRESSSIVVSQRLKRLPQILDKLERFPQTNLARIEDIGGCRAILDNQAAADRVHSRIGKQWEIVRQRDYVREPKDVTGYRGIHLVVERDARRIEIQLRTPRQQTWASAVERTAGRTGFGLKDGQGPADLVEYFRLAAEGMSYDEIGVDPPSQFTARFTEIRSQVVHYFTNSKTE